jgi:monoamine oxidase
MAFGHSGWIEDEEFNTERLYGYPKALLDSAARSDHRIKRICVVGAGVAGLTAAHELSARGHDVQVLERAKRIGGRIRTERFDDGTYGEFGAMRIPREHAIVMHYLRALGLADRPFIQENLSGLLNLRGHRTTIANFAALQAAVFPTAGGVGTKRPSAELNELIDVALKRLSGRAEWTKFEDPLSPYLQELDSMTLWEYLCGPPGPGSTAPLPFRRTLEPEEWEYLGRATGQIWFERISLLEMAVEAGALRNPNKVEIVGGMESLTDALASKLPRPVVMDAPVSRIRVSSDGVDVTWLGDSPGTALFDYVICTIPAAATLQIEFEPRLSDGKYEALSNVSYLSSGKTLVHCTDRFWELTDHIYGGASYTDLPIQQCWYPSDNASAMAQAIPGATLASHSSEKNGGYEFAADQFVARDEGNSSKPAVFTAAYLWGPTHAGSPACPMPRKTKWSRAPWISFTPAGRLRKLRSGIALGTMSLALAAARSPTSDLVSVNVINQRFGRPFRLRIRGSSSPANTSRRSTLGSKAPCKRRLWRRWRS